MSWLELWWIFPAAIAFSTIAIGSGISGALFFSPFFMLVVGLSPVQAVGAGLLTEVFGMGNGLRAYVSAKLVDYATARWLLIGAVPGVILGAVLADAIPSRVLKGFFGVGLLILAGFLILVRSPEECEPGDRAVPLIDRKSKGKGVTLIQAKDGSVYEYPTCWRPPGVAMAAVGGVLTGMISAGLPEISTTQLVVRCRVPLLVSRSRRACSRSPWWPPWGRPCMLSTRRRSGTSSLGASPAFSLEALLGVNLASTFPRS